MSCLALSLQPTNGTDILLQTRQWFPPSRALVALSSFRQTRLAFVGPRRRHRHQSAADSIASLGDDPLAASSGQLIVGVESRYRVVYRLVNGIYVLGITTADQDNSVNVFECIDVVNQAVSVLVTSCRGVDVTPEKLAKKYAEIYMALDVVLKGVSSIRLAAMLSSMHGDGIPKMMHPAVDSERKARGADDWSTVEVHSLDHLAGVRAFSKARFELPPETLAAGDEVVAAVAQSEQQDKQAPKPDETAAEIDPFAASDAIIQPEELVSGFNKDKDQAPHEVTKVLEGLDVTTLPPPEATQSTRIGVEGFEGEYGGIEFGNEQSSLGEAFEGFTDAWGGGLDASDFVGATKVAKKEGLGGLEFLHTGGDALTAAATTVPGGGTLDSLVSRTEMKGPEMHIVEEVNAEFRESLVARIGLKGVVYLKTLPPKKAGDKETEFSFRVDNTSAVKRFVVHNDLVSSLGDGVFHVRTAASEEPIPLIKYSLMPRLTPLPLRVRMVTRLIGTLLSVMIQYVSNPDLVAPLNDATFFLKLPVDPTLLKVAPKASLNRSERELKWQIPQIPIKGSPGRLRMRMPVEVGEEDIGIVGYVKFSMQGSTTLSGIALLPASEGKTDFYEVNHRYESGVYMCN